MECFTMETDWSSKSMESRMLGGSSKEATMAPLKKAKTGINGLDEILEGGLPRGRPTLLYGGPGCGKTVLAMEFICNGARQFGNPGLFVSFEESREDIKTNFASSSFGFAETIAEQTVRIESFLMTHQYSMEAGEFTLDGLLVRLGHALETSGARRLALDSISALFSRFSDTVNMRYELSRIFQWVKEKGITAVITSERSDNNSSRYGFEEYISDCVICMDHRIAGQISKRRLRVIKYRGSSHGKDEYPFLIDADGVSIFPITSLGFNSLASDEFVFTGIEGLDDMFDGKGFYRGSTVLITGGPGTGKSTVAVCFAKNACRQEHRCLFLTFEESASQIVRNMRSIGIDIDADIRSGHMHIEPIRPSTLGLEEHLVRAYKIIEAFQPDSVVLDPITAFTSIGAQNEIQAMLTRLMDHLKEKGVTTLLTSLTPGGGLDEETETAVSSIVDTWIIVRYSPTKAGRQRRINVHKARGIAHSQDSRELIIFRCRHRGKSHSYFSLRGEKVKYE